MSSAPPSGAPETYKLLPTLFQPATPSPDVNDEQEDEPAKLPEDVPASSDRTRKYSAGMFAYSRRQSESPTGTIPSYARVMHAHHAIQFAGLRSRRTSLMDRKTQSDTCLVAPTSQPRHVGSDLANELSDLKIGADGDVLRRASSNIPEYGKRDRRISVHEYAERVKGPDRSVTDPLNGDYLSGVDWAAAVQSRDSAIAKYMHLRNRYRDTGDIT